MAKRVKRPRRSNGRRARRPRTPNPGTVRPGQSVSSSSMTELGRGVPPAPPSDQAPMPGDMVEQEATVDSRELLSELELQLHRDATRRSYVERLVERFRWQDDLLARMQQTAMDLYQQASAKRSESTHPPWSVERVIDAARERCRCPVSISPMLMHTELSQRHLEELGVYAEIYEYCLRSHAFATLPSVTDVVMEVSWPGPKRLRALPLARMEEVQAVADLRELARPDDLLVFVDPRDEIGTNLRRFQNTLRAFEADLKVQAARSSRKFARRGPGRQKVVRSFEDLVLVGLAALHSSRRGTLLRVLSDYRRVAAAFGWEIRGIPSDTRAPLLARSRQYARWEKRLRDARSRVRHAFAGKFDKQLSG